MLNFYIVYANNKSLIQRVPISTPNNFLRKPISKDSLKMKGKEGVYRVIQVIDGQLVTKETEHHLKSNEDGEIQNDVENDILKIAVFSRYDQIQGAIAFTKGYGLKKGAIASSVAHDSHNIIAVGTNDEDLLSAINAVIDSKGGISLADGKKVDCIALPVAGLMSDMDGEALAKEYQRLFENSKSLGSPLYDAFMMLSFSAEDDIVFAVPECNVGPPAIVLRYCRRG